MNAYSIRAWHKYKDDGRLTAARRRCLEGLCRHAPCTGQELVRAIGYPGAWKRLSELERQNVAVREGDKICSVTGERAAIWHVDAEAELIEYQKPEGSGKMTMQQRIQLLEAEVAQLKKERQQPVATKQGVLF